MDNPAVFNRVWSIRQESDVRTVANGSYIDLKAINRILRTFERGTGVFTVSAKAIYGLCAMIHLGQSYNDRPTQIKDIALTHDIPQHYLEQLLVLLKKSGIVESFRGAGGGYSLTRSPAQTKISEILSCLDGKVEVVPDRKKDNVAALFWDDLQTVIERKMDITLEDLLSGLQEAKGKFIYTI